MAGTATDVRGSEWLVRVNRHCWEGTSTTDLVVGQRCDAAMTG